MWDCWPQIKKEWTIYKRILTWILNKCLDILSPHFIQASCAKHDRCYQKWWDEKRRFACDNKFFFFICRDLEELNVNIFKEIFLYTVAFVFYLSVREWWNLSFNYIDNE